MNTKTIHLNLFSKPVTILICILQDMKCQRIKEVIPSLNCSLINPQLICSYDQLTAAITKTVNNFLSDSMKTRSPYTEILYSLSPSTNVTESLKTFGVVDGGESAIAVRILVNGEVLGDFENELETKLNCLVEEFSLENLIKRCDLETVKQLYKPSANETSPRFYGEICSLIATKNI